MGIRFYWKGNYGDTGAFGTQKNKANLFVLVRITFESTMICHPEWSEGSGIWISDRDSSLRCATFRMTTYTWEFLESVRVMRSERTNLKKQSQFTPILKHVNSYMKGHYGNTTACGARKNKPKQSQYVSLRPEIYALGIRGTKLKIRNELKGYVWKNKANLSAGKSS